MSKKLKKIDKTDASCRKGGHKRGASPRQPNKAEKVEQRFEQAWEAKKRETIPPLPKRDFLDVEHPAELLVGNVGDLTADQLSEAMRKGRADAFAFTLARLAGLFPHASFTAALEDLGQLGLASGGLQARLHKLELARRDRYLAEEVHYVLNDLAGEGCTSEEAIRIVAFNVPGHSSVAIRDCDHSFSAIRKMVRRAWRKNEAVVTAAEPSLRAKHVGAKHIRSYRKAMRALEGANDRAPAPAKSRLRNLAGKASDGQAARR